MMHLIYISMSTSVKIESKQQEIVHSSCNQGLEEKAYEIIDFSQVSVNSDNMKDANFGEKTYATLLAIFLKEEEDENSFCSLRKLCPNDDFFPNTGKFCAVLDVLREENVQFDSNAPNFPWLKDKIQEQMQQNELNKQEDETADSAADGKREVTRKGPPVDCDKDEVLTELMAQIPENMRSSLEANFDSCGGYAQCPDGEKGGTCRYKGVLDCLVKIRENAELSLILHEARFCAHRYYCSDAKTKFSTEEQKTRTRGDKYFDRSKIWCLLKSNFIKPESLKRGTEAMELKAWEKLLDAKVAAYRLK